MIKLRKLERREIEYLFETLYLIAFALVLITSFIETTTFVIEWPYNYYNMLRVFLISSVFLRAIYSEAYSLKDSLVTVMICITFLMCWRVTGADLLINALLFIVGSKGISYRKIMKIYVFVTGSMLIITMTAALMGQIENYAYVQNGRRIRQAFGIVYPTDFAAHLFFTILGYGYLRKSKIKYIELGIIVLLGIAVSYFCDARTSMICIICTAGALLYNKLRVRFSEKKGQIYVMNPIWSFFLAMSTVICAAFMTLATIFYSSDNRISELLDHVLSGRLLLGKKGAEIFGFSLYGQYIPMQGNGGTSEDIVRYFFIDSSYISIALKYGLLVMATVLIISCIVGFRAREKKEWVLLWMLAIAAVQCMIEHHMIEISYYPFFWAALAALSGDSKMKLCINRKGIRWENYIVD